MKEPRRPYRWVRSPCRSPAHRELKSQFLGQPLVSLDQDATPDSWLRLDATSTSAFPRNSSESMVGRGELPGDGGPGETSRAI